MKVNTITTRAGKAAAGLSALLLGFVLFSCGTETPAPSNEDRFREGVGTVAFSEKDDCCTPGEHLECQDGIWCNGEESCDCWGSCEVGPPVNCDDGDFCTNDYCINDRIDPPGSYGEGHCEHRCVVSDICPCDDCERHSDCDDGNACTEDLCDFGEGVCMYNDRNCNDDNLCTEDSCDIITGCVNDWIDGCCIVDGDCNDLLACTTDDCDELTNTCSNELVDRFCLIDDICYPEGAVNPANTCESCQTAVRTDDWSILGAGTPCEDGNFCTNGETCDMFGNCVGGSDPCVDGIPCTDDTCDEDTDACVYPIQDGKCLIGGVCYDNGDRNPANSCQECRSTSRKDAWTPLSEGAACDDGLFCTLTDTCNAAGLCTGTGSRCDDGITCTSDVCNEGSDTCSNPIMAGWCRIGGTCYANGDGNPGNVCQECRSATSQTAWSNKPAGTSCDDALFCNGTNTCNASGNCVAGTPPCTSSSCITSTCNEATDTCDETITAGWCYIATRCYANGDDNPANTCQWCQSTITQTAWTDKLAAIINNSGAVIGEAGTASGNTGSSSSWRTVNLDYSYANPVVIMQPASYNDADRGGIRLRNVTATSFQWQFDEWDYLDGAHASETMGYMVMEAGAHRLSDGRRMEAGTLDVDHNWASRGFTQSFTSSPTVLTQSQTRNGGAAITTRERNITTAGFEVRCQEEGSGGSHSAETVGYIAIQPGTGTAEGVIYEVANTSDAVTHAWYSISFSQTFGVTPVFLAGMQTYDGGDPATLRYRNLSTSGVQVFVEEEQSSDAETNHTTEVVGYFALNVAATCDDGLYCTGVDVCSAGGNCVGSGDPCTDDGLACTSETCNEATDSCDSDVINGWCLIGGVTCVANGTEHSLNECLWCDSTADDDDWSFKPYGEACTPDTHDCTSDICNGLGACIHEIASQPSNDQCGGATAMSPSGSGVSMMWNTAGDSYCALNHYNACGAAGASPDVFYSYDIPTEYALYRYRAHVAAPEFDTLMYLFGGQVVVPSCGQDGGRTGCNDTGDGTCEGVKSLLGGYDANDSCYLFKQFSMPTGMQYIGIDTGGGTTAGGNHSVRVERYEEITNQNCIVDLPEVQMGGTFTNSTNRSEYWNTPWYQGGGVYSYVSNNWQCLDDNTISWNPYYSTPHVMSLWHINHTVDPWNIERGYVISTNGTDTSGGYSQSIYFYGISCESPMYNLGCDLEGQHTRTGSGFGARMTTGRIPAGRMSAVGVWAYKQCGSDAGCGSGSGCDSPCRGNFAMTVEVDTDGDGLPDSVDACPGTMWGNADSWGGWIPATNNCGGVTDAGTLQSYSGNNYQYWGRTVTHLFKDGATTHNYTRTDPFGLGAFDGPNKFYAIRVPAGRRFGMVVQPMMTSQWWSGDIYYWNPSIMIYRPCEGMWYYANGQGDGGIEHTGWFSSCPSTQTWYVGVGSPVQSGGTSSGWYILWLMGS